MTYWDSSALIGAIQSNTIAAKISTGEQATRLHSMVEVFSTITGGRLGFRVLPSDAAEIIQKLIAKFQIVELTQDEIQRALNEAEERGVRGGRVHDWLHAAAATKSGAKELLTFNTGDFVGLGNWTISTP